MRKIINATIITPETQNQAGNQQNKDKADGYRLNIGLHILLAKKGQMGRVSYRSVGGRQGRLTRPVIDMLRK